MNLEILKLLIEQIKLQIKILQIQLAILLFNEKRTIPNLPKPKYIMIHHSAGNETFEQVNQYHKSRWGFRSSLGFFCGYHKFIDYTGKLYVARLDNEIGAHCVDPNNPGFWNKNSVGICLRGNFQTEEPTEGQLKTLKMELDKYDVPVKMHYEVISTACPGKHLIKWVKEYRFLAGELKYEKN